MYRNRKLLLRYNLSDDGGAVAEDDVGDDGLAGRKVVAYALAIEVVIDIIMLSGIARWRCEEVDSRRFFIGGTQNDDIEDYSHIVVEGILHRDDEVLRMVSNRSSITLSVLLDILYLVVSDIDRRHEIRVFLASTISLGIQFDRVAVEIQEVFANQSQQRYSPGCTISKEPWIVGIFRNDVAEVTASIQCLMTPL